MEMHFACTQASDCLLWTNCRDPAALSAVSACRYIGALRVKMGCRPQRMNTQRRLAGVYPPRFYRQFNARS